MHEQCIGWDVGYFEKLKTTMIKLNFMNLILLNKFKTYIHIELLYIFVVVFYYSMNQMICIWIACVYKYL